VFVQCWGGDGRRDVALDTHKADSWALSTEPRPATPLPNRAHPQDVGPQHLGPRHYQRRQVLLGDPQALQKGQLRHQVALGTVAEDLGEASQHLRPLLAGELQVVGEEREALLRAGAAVGDDLRVWCGFGWAVGWLRVAEGGVHTQGQEPTTEARPHLRALEQQLRQLGRLPEPFALQQLHDGLHAIGCGKELGDSVDRALQHWPVDTVALRQNVRRGGLLRCCGCRRPQGCARGHDTILLATYLGLRWPRGWLGCSEC